MKRKTEYCLGAVVIVLLSVFEWFTVSGQSMPVNYLGREHGLSNNDVTCIFKDSAGFMWFGTYDGLNRYDGYGFRKYKHIIDDSFSLKNNRISAIAEDDEQRMWIGSRRGLSILNKNTGRFSSLFFKPWQLAGLQESTTDINEIKRDKAGNMLVATSGQGLLLVKKKQDTAIQVPCYAGSKILTNYHVLCMELTSAGKVWFIVRGAGLCAFDYQTGIAAQVDGNVKDGNCIRYDGTGNLWVGSFKGLLKYTIQTRVIQTAAHLGIQLPGENVAALCYDSNHRLWIATDGGGVNILDKQEQLVSHLQPTPSKKTLMSLSVDALYEDASQRMWIGTLRGGINIVDYKKNRFLTVSHNPTNNNSLIGDFVLSFCEEPSGNIWIGTDGNGLSYWNRAGNRFTNYRHTPGNNTSLSSNFVTSLLRDSHDGIWVTTYGGGICKFLPGTQSFRRYTCPTDSQHTADYVWTMYEDAEQNLWAGTIRNTGLFKYNREKDRFEVFDKRLTNIITLYEDRNHVLWAGTYSDLVKINTAGGTAERHTIGSAVRSIHEDDKGRFWVGTEGNGLLLFNRSSGKSLAYSESQGLANNAVLNILEDKSHRLWLSTFDGLSVFHTDKKTFTNYFESDGLQSNQFNYTAAMATRKGEFLFGGIKGFNIFHPDSISVQIDMPPLRITSVAVNNMAIEQQPELLDENKGSNYLAIPYYKATLSVDFAALEYSTPDKVSYAIYLEGQDKEWKTIGKLRSANYSHLHEGSYVLHIKSTNADNTWNAQDTVLHIRILPPWYRSWWAYLLYVSALAGCIYWYLRYKRRQQQLKYEVKLSHMNAEKEKELHEAKLDFFTSISHEFRTPLTLIINPVKEVVYGNVSTTAAREKLTVVYRNARRLLGLADQLLLFRKADSEVYQLQLSQVDFITQCKEVYLCFLEQAHHKALNYEFKPPEIPLELCIDKEKIDIVLFNLLSNAIKYAPHGGQVSMELTANNNIIKVSVTDNGPGISDTDKEKLFRKFYQGTGQPAKTGFGIGLFVANSFARLHKGEISCTSTNGQTVFTLLLPKVDIYPDQATLPEHNTPSLFLEELAGRYQEEGDDTTTEDTFISDLPSMLIVDDNQEIREYIAGLFEADFALHQAAGGEEALVMARKFLPDIIISDVVMKEGNGTELCMAIKQDATTQHIPVILLTAATDADIKLKGIELGADDYITKPFDKDILIARVNNLLQKQSAMRQYFFNEITLQKNDLKISEESKVFLDKCIAIVEENIDNEDFNVKLLATEIGMSHSALYKKIKDVSGQSARAFVRFIRLRRAAVTLVNSSCNINEAAFQAGIKDVKYFRREFHKLFGMNPSDYVKKYRKPFRKNYSLDEEAFK